MSDAPVKNKGGRPRVPKPPKKANGRPRKPVVDPADIDPLVEIDTMVSKAPIKRQVRFEFNEERLRILSKLAAIFCTQDEICSVLGISSFTLRNAFQRQPEAREIYEDGLLRARVSLRRKQFDLAGRQTIMAIFLGKNFLGQKDVHTTDMTLTKKAAEMTMEQLLEIAGQAVPDNKPDKAVH